MREHSVYVCIAFNQISPQQRKKLNSIGSHSYSVLHSFDKPRDDWWQMLWLGGAWRTHAHSEQWDNGIYGQRRHHHRCMLSTLATRDINRADSQSAVYLTFCLAIELNSQVRTAKPSLKYGLCVHSTRVVSRRPMHNNNWNLLDANRRLVNRRANSLLNGRWTFLIFHFVFSEWIVSACLVRYALYVRFRCQSISPSLSLLLPISVIFVEYFFYLHMRSFVFALTHA